MALYGVVPGARLQPLCALHCFAEQGSMGWLGCVSLRRDAQLGGPIASSPMSPHCLGFPLLCKVNTSMQSLEWALRPKCSNEESCSGCLHPLRNGGLEALGAESSGCEGAQGAEISMGAVLGHQVRGVHGAGCSERAVLVLGAGDAQFWVLFVLEVHAAGSSGCTALRDRGAGS